LPALDSEEDSRRRADEFLAFVPLYLGEVLNRGRGRDVVVGHIGCVIVLDDQSLQRFSTSR